jgi:hypothetical protein
VDAGSITAVVMLKLKWQGERGKWTWDKCRLERLWLLEEKLHNVLLQTDELPWENKTLEEQLRLATAGREVGRRDMVPGERKAAHRRSILLCNILSESQMV